TGLLASGFTLLVLLGGRRIEQLLSVPLNGLHGDGDEPLESEVRDGPGPVASRRWGGRRTRVP
ncbi:MAG TPA: hypothetical protein VFT84_01245, partial [Gemmatimonadales bacterium]|nr:hypothetical protein [Gemmatimonadales bacterium]